ncbi:hypothetical protein HYFRA_00001507 [Hymenoscyphus fraxineus]|uniref:Uncharacterized protein n=1 Tax=Hymenoscyphus fraxineus TaxID=746836 RepID=A0A9N9L3I8_9HELO|nr:hypothetical protein HYFRA_00001507 [Hymenoscyphus fraxineus]
MQVHFPCELHPELSMPARWYYARATLLGNLDINSDLEYNPGSLTPEEILKLRYSKSKQRRANENPAYPRLGFIFIQYLWVYMNTLVVSLDFRCNCFASASVSLVKTVEGASATRDSGIDQHEFGTMAIDIRLAIWTVGFE